MTQLERVSVLADTYRFRAFAVIAIERATLVAGAPFLAVGGPFRRWEARTGRPAEMPRQRSQAAADGTSGATV